jgi:tetratricopeptide (TPR) repeat protein
MVHPEAHIVLTAVLYSSASGWWKIADFGLTSSATSRRLRTTTGQRGKPCYRAPELVRDFGLGIGFSRKVDIWSLGCILFELCIGYKAFKHDFDTDDFASGKTDLKIEITSFTDRAPLYEKLITEMLNPRYDSRPSIKEICDNFTEIVKSDAEPGVDGYEGSVGEDFIRWENMLGTSVPSVDGFHSMQWDLGLPGQELSLDRWKHMIEARSKILGKKHPNTIWARFSYAWAFVSTGSLELAVGIFEELLEQSENVHKLWAYYGLGWALTDLGRLGDADRTSGKGLEMAAKTNEDDSMGRFILGAKSALARGHLLWRPQEQNVEYLNHVVSQQTALIGYDHPDTLTSRALLAIAELLQHRYAGTTQSEQRLSEASQSESKVFRTERPAILTLCQLSWTLARNSKVVEARRVFDETVRWQRKYYGKENVLPEISLEALTQSLQLGPIRWVNSEPVVRSGNNPFGSKGTRSCGNCRARKIKVSPYEMFFNSSVSLNGVEMEKTRADIALGKEKNAAQSC